MRNRCGGCYGWLLDDASQATTDCLARAIILHARAGATSIVGRISCPQSRRSARCRTRPWVLYRLRDDGIVPLICPTCQNVFAGSLKASIPATTMLLCMGLFSIFYLGAGIASALAAVFPDDDRRMACQAVARGRAACLAARGSASSPSSLSLRSSYAGHASPFGPAWLRHA